MYLNFPGIFRENVERMKKKNPNQMFKNSLAINIKLMNFLKVLAHSEGEKVVKKQKHFT